eukprot:TRINITY_DN61636_c0_g1_i1.p1 TRINITY_DN61636_c0_g1~~TRINITY_DN61636_c0_g1_i1.p1  ORF type:complete len:100 (+),score=11.86 TRINITY_DN61636_c0_g1_i1:1-300(+)
MKFYISGLLLENCFHLVLLHTLQEHINLQRREEISFSIYVGCQGLEKKERLLLKEESNFQENHKHSLKILTQKLQPNLFLKAITWVEAHDQVFNLSSLH